MRSNAIERVIDLILAVILFWILISWMDVIADNWTDHPEHYDWNFFVLLVKYGFMLHNM